MQRAPKVFAEPNFAQFGETLKLKDSATIFMVLGLSGEAKDLQLGPEADVKYLWLSKQLCLWAQ